MSISDATYLNRSYSNRNFSYLQDIGTRFNGYLSITGPPLIREAFYKKFTSGFIILYLPNSGRIITHHPWLV
jgi:hypothetical protein